MEPLKAELIGIPRSISEISSIIGKLISVVFQADVIQAEALEVDLGDINISASYDPELDSMGRPCIELVLVYNPLEKLLVIDEELFLTVTRRLCDSICHEQIHQQQYRSRFWEWGAECYDEDDAVQYLGNKDEIDAYSYNIANELLDFTDAKNALTLLYTPSKIRLEHSVNLWAYLATFKSISHPVIKRLLKKVVRLLPVVSQQR